MTKARTVAQKRRRRGKSSPGTITLAGGETATQRPAQGARGDIDRDPTATVTAARIRKGISPDDARHPMAGCAVGRRLLIEHLPDRAELWQAVKHIRQVWIAYDRACGAPNRHAQCLRIMTPSDAMRADASTPAPDPRTEEERYRAAVSAWMAMQGWLSRAEYADRAACARHVVDEPDEAISNWSGIVVTLRCVARGMQGHKM